MERAKESFHPRPALNPKGVRRRAAVACMALLAAAASLLAYAKERGDSRGPYGLADDCPRGALVYAQAADLPELLRLWEGSELKDRYLGSTNFRQFQNGNVALKLVARWREFSEALGFTLDAAALARTAEKRAALAVYDIGRMELVFVAPVGEEKALATRFFRDAATFEETELPDGTVFYSRDVEADRGRQRQKILFAFVKGRFVLSTGEQLMLRTLANINGKSRADRLSDDTSFKSLSGALAPHFATVWVDQTKLNGDYYFKHYWVTADVASLKDIRAGIFDFEMRDGGWVERREYLVEHGRGRRGAAPDRRDLGGLSASIPPDAAYARVSVLDNGAESAAALVRNALLDHTPEAETGGGSGGRLHEDFDPVSEGATDYYWEGGYSYLGGDYDERIDDPEDAEEDKASRGGVDLHEKAYAGLGHVFGKARPSQGALAQSPHPLDGPLFVEFRKLAIVRLDNPAGLDPQAFERAVTSVVTSRLTVAGALARLSWADGGTGARLRELALPMLGWKVCYALRGRELFVANDVAFLEAALEGGREAKRRPAESRFAPDDLTVIRLERKDQAFGRVFDNLDSRRVRDYWERRGRAVSVGRDAPAEEFFSGNVKSLLDVTGPVSSVEIRRRSARGRLSVEVEVVMSDAAPGEGAR